MVNCPFSGSTMRNERIKIGSTISEPPTLAPVATVGSLPIYVEQLRLIKNINRHLK